MPVERTKDLRSVTFISPYVGDAVSGGSLVSRNNLSCLCDVFDSVNVIALTNAPVDLSEMRLASLTTLPPPKGILATAAMNFLLTGGRLSFRSAEAIKVHLDKVRPSVVFLDSSSLGRLAALVKSANEAIKVVTFFHNIEFDFAMQRSRAEGPQYWISAVCERYNERVAVRRSDVLISLHAEDSRRMRNLYGRDADFALPIALGDSENSSISCATGGAIQSSYYLFVGSKFFANIEALGFLSKQVAPRLSHQKILVVGRGLEAFRSQHESPGLRIVGTVDDLAPYYRGAKAVLCPVFSGAGMKVKIAEALKYGRKIAASDFALKGYETDSDDAVFRHCNDADDYVRFIEECDSAPESFMPAARQLFEARHSRSASLARMQREFGRLGVISRADD